MEQRLDDPTWHRALTLAERLGGSPPPALDTPAERELARRRLARWRSLAAFETPGLFERRLAAAGWDEERLLAVLGESPERLRERQTEIPDWLAALAEAYASAPATRPRQGAEESAAVAGEDAFAVLWRPLVRWAQAGLEAAVGTLPPLPAQEAPFDPATVASLFVPWLAGDLHQMGTRTVVLELQVARLEGSLAGDTPEERFASFVDGLRRPERALALLALYPVLARKAVLRARTWIATSRELLERLTADWRLLRRELLAESAPGEGPGPLAEIDGGAGDSHRGGRSVALLRFASGLRLVYKPKPLAGDVAFGRLLEWLNGRGFTPAFRPLRVVDRGDYGWAEHIAAAPAASRDEIRRIYRRQGGYLALLYLLQATDFHAENLIAAGEQPVLVDLETLFHPRVDAPDLAAEAYPGEDLGGSVLRSGLLPQRLFGDDEHGGVDLSGLGSVAGQVTRPFLGLAGQGTDEMRLELRPMQVTGVHNRPELPGETVALADHVEDLEEGFRTLYHTILDHREALLAADGPLAAFAELPMRVVIRPTMAYGTLLLESCHPHVLGSGLEQRRHLDRVWGGVRHRPWLEALIPHELADLEAGDVPLFASRPGSRDLWTSRGDRLPDFFAKPALATVARRLAGWGLRDLERQHSVIGKALAPVVLETSLPPRPTPGALAEAAAPATRESLLAAARRAGDQLATLAFEEGEYAHWLILHRLEVGTWVTRAAQPDLYLGLPGIALFLAHLGKVTGEDHFTRLARGALATQRWQIAEETGAVTGIGAFNGWGGVIYALAQLGILWQDDRLLAEAEGLAGRLAAEIAGDPHHDVIAGAAGALLALLALHRASPSADTFAAAVACGEHLLARAQPMPRGVGWVSPVAGSRPVAGLSHGAAGIILALARLGQESGDHRFLDAAAAGIAYERTLYSPAERNWPDLRDGAEDFAAHGGTHYMCTWCHGAAGIGLARLAGLDALDTPEIREDITVATATTLDHALCDNHSLCHGALGNLELLAGTARWSGDDALRARVGRLAGGVLASLELDGWLYGATPGTAPPGLMTGLAGIGYGLLRLAEPDRIPNVLALAPPPGEPARALRSALVSSRPIGRTP